MYNHLVDLWYYKSRTKQVCRDTISEVANIRLGIIEKTWCRFMAGSIQAIFHYKIHLCFNNVILKLVWPKTLSLYSNHYFNINNVRYSSYGDTNWLYKWINIRFYYCLNVSVPFRAEMIANVCWFFSSLCSFHQCPLHVCPSHVDHKFSFMFNLKIQFWIINWHFYIKFVVEIY